MEETMVGAKRLSWKIAGFWFAIHLLALGAGFLWGATADLTIFFLVRPSLPPPWRWLPPSDNYQLLYYALLSLWVVPLVLAHRKVENWQRLFLSAGVLYWLVVVVSFVVVEVLGEREGPRHAGGELVLVSFYVASAGVTTIVMIFFLAYAVVSWGTLLYRRLFHS